MINFSDNGLSLKRDEFYYVAQYFLYWLHILCDTFLMEKLLQMNLL